MISLLPVVTWGSLKQKKRKAELWFAALFPPGGGVCEGWDGGCKETRVSQPQVGEVCRPCSWELLGASMAWGPGRMQKPDVDIQQWRPAPVGWETLGPSQGNTQNLKESSAVRGHCFGWWKGPDPQGDGNSKVIGRGDSG